MEQHQKDSQVVKKVWSNYGEKDPYFSVLTEERYKMENFNQHEAEFWNTGKENVELLRRIYERYHAHTKEEKPRVLDYGCGVGRMMKAWGEGCEGCDISPAHLAKAREALGSAHPLHLVEPGECPKGYDVIYSMIVLQHNRPSVMKQCMKSIVEALNPRGLAMIHAPYFIETVYQSDEIMEMNFVPKPEMEEVINQAGGRVLSYDETHDSCGGGIKNCIYIIYKGVDGEVFFQRVLNHTEPSRWGEMPNM